jgi:hypothetical protein
MVFLFRSEKKISDNTRVRIFFFVAHSANFFFQNLTLSYMTKILNQIYSTTGADPGFQVRGGAHIKKIAASYT